MKHNPLEMMLGAVVIVAALFFSILVFNISDGRSVEGYELIARFDSVDGLSEGSDVRLAGIKIGKVMSQSLDTETYLAIIKIVIDEQIKIPKDSVIQVVSESLLGGRYMSIIPGADESMLMPGEEIRYTQSAVNIETLITRFAGGSD